MHAQSEASPLELSWDAPTGCPSQQDVLARTRDRLPEAMNAQAVRATATVTATTSGFHLVLALRGPELDASKELDVESCEAAADAAALLIALALDPSAVKGASGAEATPTAPLEEGAPQEPAPPTAPAPEATTPPPAPARPPASTRPAPAPVLRESDEEPHVERPTAPLALAWSAGAAVAIGSGVLPQGLSWGLRPWVALSIDRVRASGGFTAWLEGEAATERRGASLNGAALAGDLGFGFELLQARPSVAPYALIELARLAVETTGVTDPATATAAWLGGGVGVQVGYEVVGPLRVTVDPALLFPIRQPRWRLHTSSGDITLFPASAVALRLSLGVAYTFR